MHERTHARAQARRTPRHRFAQRTQKPHTKSKTILNTNKIHRNHNSSGSSSLERADRRRPAVVTHNPKTTDSKQNTTHHSSESRRRPHFRAYTPPCPPDSLPLVLFPFLPCQPSPPSLSLSRRENQSIKDQHEQERPLLASERQRSPPVPSVQQHRALSLRGWRQSTRRPPRLVRSPPRPSWYSSEPQETPPPPHSGFEGPTHPHTHTHREKPTVYNSLLLVRPCDITLSSP